MTERVEQSFYSQCPPEERPAFLFETGDATLKQTTSTNGGVSRRTTRSSKSPDTEDHTIDDESGNEKQGNDSETAPVRSTGKAQKQPKEPSLLRALHSVYWLQFWTGGILKLFSGMSYPCTHIRIRIADRVLPLDTLNTTTPLVNQVLLSWLSTSFVYYRASEEERATLGLSKPQGIGYGIGLAFAVFVMQGEPHLTLREVSGSLYGYYGRGF